MIVELENRTSSNQTVTVYIGDEETVRVPIYIEHDGEEVTDVTIVSIPDKYETDSEGITGSIIDEVYKSFEPEPDEEYDDPDRDYEERFDK
jgi:hypothetical protein